MSSNEKYSAQVVFDFELWLKSLDPSKPIHFEILNGLELQREAALLAWMAAYEFYQGKKD